MRQKLFAEITVNSLKRKLFFTKNGFVPAEDECATTEDPEEKEYNFRLSFIVIILFIISYSLDEQRFIFLLSLFLHYILEISRLFSTMKERKHQKTPKTESVTRLSIFIFIST